MDQVSPPIVKVLSTAVDDVLGRRGRRVGRGEFEEEGDLKKMKVRRGRKSEITSTRISGVVVVICDGFGSGWLLGLSCKTGSSISGSGAVVTFT